MEYAETNLNLILLKRLPIKWK